MLNAIGIDRGSSGDREVSVNLFSGATTQGSAAPSVGQYVALPSSGLTFRRLFLPPASKAIRQQVIAEELSYSLPFSLTEAHYGSVEKGEEAWVVIASDSVVQPVKALYGKAHLEAEPLCYLRAAKAANIEDALVIDFGASKTVFCGLEHGQVGTVRVLLRGGDALSEELARSLECTAHEAEMIKREEGVDHRVVREFFLELLEEALLPLPLPYRTVLICGGGSATPGLLGLLAKRYGDDVAVEPFPLPDMLMPTDHVVAYGAALAGRFNATRLKMDHSFRQMAQSGGGPLRLGPLLATLVMMVLMVVATESRLSSLRTKEANLTETLNQAVTPVLPNAAEFKSQEMVAQLKERVKTQRALGRRAPARIMNTLGRCSDAFTNKEGATLFSVIFEDDKLKLEGKATSLKQSEEIKRELESVLDEVVMGKSRPTGKAFVFQIDGRVPEQ